MKTLSETKICNLYPLAKWQEFPSFLWLLEFPRGLNISFQFYCVVLFGMRLQLWSTIYNILRKVDNWSGLLKTCVLRHIRLRSFAVNVHLVLYILGQHFSWVVCWKSISSDCYGNLSISSFSLRAIKSPITKEIWEMECLHPQDNNHLNWLQLESNWNTIFWVYSKGEKSASMMETYCAMDEKSANKLLRWLWMNQNKKYHVHKKYL